MSAKSNTAKVSNELSAFLKPSRKKNIGKRAAIRDRVAVIYTRVSTKEQAETNQSLETQLERCKAYAKEKGYEVVGCFGGTYESAKNDERLEFKKMLDFVKKSKYRIGYIIVYSHDRFSRSGPGAIYIADELSKLGIALVAVTQPVDTQTATGRLQQGIQFLFSEFDNNQRKEKCMAGMLAVLRKGYWPAHAPIGYDQSRVNGEQKITPNKTGKLIRQAFQLKAEQDLTNVEIAKRLQTQGLKMSKQDLTRIFANPFYCGLITHSMLEEGEVIVGKHQPLISREIFMRVNGIQAQNTQGYTWVRDNESLPLRHHIKCGDCDKPMTGYIVKAKGIHYYKCNTVGCKLNKNAGIMHNLYQDLLSQYQVDPKLMQEVLLDLEMIFEKMNKDKKEEESRLQEQLKEEMKKLEQLERRFAFGEVGAEIYQKYSGEVRQKGAEIEVSIKNLKSGLSNHQQLIKKGLKLSLTLSKSWSSGSGRQRQKLQTLLFPEGVHFDRENQTYRTNRINSFFALSKQLEQILEQKISGLSNQIDQKSASVAGARLELTTFGL